MNVFIYALTDPETQQIRYVGKTVNLRSRITLHLCDSREDCRRTRWIRSIRDRGLKPGVEILEELHGPDAKNWPASERFWISYLRFLGFRLVNTHIGGVGGNLGQRHSEETKQKISAGNSGKKHTAIARKNMSIAHIGQIVPQEVRDRISAGNRGKHVSSATREKLSIAGKGKSFTPQRIANLRAARQRRSIREAAAKLQFS